MKIAVLVEGSAEFDALKIILDKINSQHGIVAQPIFASMEPKATPKQIALAAMTKINVAKSTGKFGKFIVAIDFEDKPDCHIKFKQDLEKVFRDTWQTEISVIIKYRKFENWLIADPDAISSMRARFKVSESDRRKIEPNLADHVHDASNLLNKMAIENTYDKGQDPKRIASKMDISKSAGNSRSFRRFLRALGHPDYAAQSKNPKR